jgi:hypothetical protein
MWGGIQTYAEHKTSTAVAHVDQVQRTNFPLWFRMTKDRVYEGTSRTLALRPGYMKYVEGIKIVLLTHM